jgi:hypothetical protein
MWINTVNINICDYLSFLRDHLRLKEINPFDASRPEGRGLLRVDTERRFFTLP